MGAGRGKGASRRHICPRCGAAQPWFALFLTARGGLRRFAMQPFAPCPGCGARLRLVPRGSEAALALAQVAGGALFAGMGMLLLMVVSAIAPAAGWPGIAAGFLLWSVIGNLALWRIWQEGMRHLWCPEAAPWPGAG